jgi:aminoglycoside/choline kinase family phosphotransferase
MGTHHKQNNDFKREVREMIDHVTQLGQLGQAGAGSANYEAELSNWVKKTKVIDSLVKLPGDASTRSYYRIGSGGKTYIAMKMEPFADHGDNLPFLVVQKHLASAGVDVPAVLDTDPARGFILLEDLGDVTLLRQLQEVCNADVERHLYERVIDDLVRLQVQASPQRKPADIEAYKLRFDHEKLMWEVSFCIEHFYERYLARDLKPEDKQLMIDGFGEICTLLANEPTVLTHRDFHCRNVMVVPGEDGSIETSRLVMIDFQDARLGPAQYDLASLLKDSYYQLEEQQIQTLLNYYVARWEAASGERVDRARFQYVFDMMHVQRNFKAIGSFASFLNRRGNATYLKYIGNTFENIRRTLLKYPRYARLREVLFHYYYF